MDGTRLVLKAVERNFDGLTDRWEYCDANWLLENVGFQQANGTTVNRTGFYHAGTLVRAEEDSDGDTKPDKWETYRGGALASVEIDTTRDGRPDRRLTYGPDGVKAEQLR